MSVFKLDCLLFVFSLYWFFPLFLFSPFIYSVDSSIYLLSNIIEAYNQNCFFYLKSLKNADQRYKKETGSKNQFHSIEYVWIKKKKQNRLIEMTTFFLCLSNSLNYF